MTLDKIYISVRIIMKENESNAMFALSKEKKTAR